MSKKKKSLIVFGIVAVIILILLIGYFVMANHYKNRFLLKSSINGIVCDDKEAVEVVALLKDHANEYYLDIYGRNPSSPEENILLGTVHASDIQYSNLDYEEVVKTCMSSQNPMKWYETLFSRSYDFRWEQDITYNEDLLVKNLDEMDAFQYTKMTAARDAYVADYSEEEKKYLVIAEGPGSCLIRENALNAIKGAISAGADTINLEEYDCYLVANKTSDDRNLNRTAETLNKWLNTSITYDWHGIEVLVDRTVIKDWLSFDDNTPTLDEEAVAEFIKEISEEYDTYGRPRKFTTTLGIEVEVPSKYGWQVDREAEAEELIQLVYDGAAVVREPVYKMKAYSKDVNGNDMGTSYVEIDLSNQHLYLYIEGEMILETDFVSGCLVNGCYTPPGLFGVTYKTRNAILRGANYATPVKYWMPFNRNIGMHDATWRRSFGDEIFFRNGSHGCINLPLKMAESIYEYMEAGFPVICYYYEPVEDLIYRVKHPNAVKVETPLVGDDEKEPELQPQQPQSQPEQPAQQPQPQPEQPAQQPQPQPEQPAEQPQPQPEQPAEQPQPEQPAEQPQPEQPAEQPQPEQPAEQPQPEQPAEQPQPEQPAEQPQPEQPAEQPQPEQLTE